MATTEPPTATIEERVALLERDRLIHDNRITDVWLRVRKLEQQRGIIPALRPTSESPGRQPSPDSPPPALGLPGVPPTTANLSPVPVVRPGRVIGSAAIAMRGQMPNR